MNVKIKSSYSKQNFSNIVNLQSRDVIYENLNIGTQIKSVFSGVFNFHLGTHIELNDAQSQIISNRSINYFSFLDMSARYKEFNLGIQLERFSFKNPGQPTNSFDFMDLQFNYRNPDDKFDFSIVGNNLFNTKRFTDLFVTDLNVSSTDYRLIDRYLLLRVNFKF